MPRWGSNWEVIPAVSTPTDVLQRRYFVHRFLGTRRWEPPTKEDWHQQSIPSISCIDCGLNTPWGLCSQCLPSLDVTGSIVWRWFDAFAADGKLCQRMVFCMGAPLWSMTRLKGSSRAISSPVSSHVNPTHWIGWGGCRRWKWRSLLSKPCEPLQLDTLWNAGSISISGEAGTW